MTLLWISALWKRSDLVGFGNRRGGLDCTRTRAKGENRRARRTAASQVNAKGGRLANHGDEALA
ncbi:hypothetical protein HMPREF0185_02279 [Brevundimonas diminuta 470-4]|nr:hypothetical protein HMPREF0185_02279 [Brevundimonas diminuta 470-4]